MAKLAYFMGVWVLANAARVQEGTAFVDSGSLAFSSLYHTIVLRMDLGGLERNLDNILHYLDGSRLTAKDHTFPLANQFVREVEQMELVTNGAKLELEQFLGSVGGETNRAKRGIEFKKILSLAGNMLGLASEAELKAIEKELTKEYLKTHVMVNGLVSQMLASDRNLEILARAVNRTETAFLALKGHITQTDDILRNFSSDLVYTNALNFLAFGVNDAGNEVSRTLAQVTTMMTSHRVSPHFLTPHMLQDVLTRLQSTVSLLFPPTKEYLPLYYQLMHVQVKRQGDHLLLFVRVPLKGDSLLYDLYQVVPSWYTAEGGSWGQRVVVDTPYLAIRRDSKFAVTLQSLDNCLRTTGLTICEPITGFTGANPNNCLFALFKNLPNATTSCSFLFKKNYAPQFLKLGANWVASTPVPLQATEVCPESNRKVTINKGVSIVPITNHCFISGRDFHLPSFKNHLDAPMEIEIGKMTPLLDVPLPREIESVLKETHLDSLPQLSRGQLLMLSDRKEKVTKVKNPWVLIAVLTSIAMVLVTSLGCAFCLYKLRAAYNCCTLASLRSNRSVSRPKGAPNKPTRQARSTSVSPSVGRMLEAFRRPNSRTPVTPPAPPPTPRPFPQRPSLTVTKPLGEHDHDFGETVYCEMEVMVPPVVETQGRQGRALCDM